MDLEICPMHSRIYAIEADKFQFKDIQRIIQGRTHKIPITWRSSNMFPRNYPLLKFITLHPLQAIAARSSIGTDVTIVSIDSSQSQQLPKPVRLTEDFNSYHQIWGNPANDSMGMPGFEFY